MSDGVPLLSGNQVTGVGDLNHSPSRELKRESQTVSPGSSVPFGTQWAKCTLAMANIELSEGLSMTTASGIIRILVVEDFKPFRQFHCSRLGTRPEFHVVAEASDGLEAVRLAKDLQPDLILLDVGLPKLNGIDAARQIRTLAPKAKIIFVSQESSASVVEEALAIGAAGYVLKTDAIHLLAAVDAVLAGGQFVSALLSGPALVASNE